MSPTTVIDPDSERRATIRSCIGDRSWASSTTTWPKVAGLVVASGAGPAPGRAQQGPGLVEQGDVARRSSAPRRRWPPGGRRSSRRSAGSRTLAAASSISGAAPKRSCSSCCGVRIGHMRSRAATTSGWRRRCRPSSSAVSGSPVASDRADPSPSGASLLEQAPPQQAPRRSGGGRCGSRPGAWPRRPPEPTAPG